MNLRSALLHLSRTSKPPFSASLPAQVVLWCAGAPARANNGQAAARISILSHAPAWHPVQAL